MTGSAKPDRRARLAARAAAVAAIVCLLGALALAAWALAAGQVWRLVVATLAVLVTIFGAWYALAHRGVVRVAGMVAALGGLAGFLVVAVTGRYHGLALAGALVLTAVSSSAAGYALSVPAAAPEPVVDVRTRPAGTERRVLIMNPLSGGGKVGQHHLPDECRDRGIEPVLLRPGDDLRGLAVDAIRRGADVIGMAGGDGSQALVATVAAEHAVPYVCIPAGTRNHLALDLGIDRDDVVGALDAFDGGAERRVDLATVNGRVFVNNVSMGVYARIVQSDAYRDAKLKTAADMLPEMLGPGCDPFDLRFTPPDGTEWPYAHMLLVSNNPYDLDRLIGGGTRPRMDTGRLGIAAARIEGPAAAAAFLALETAGHIRQFEGWQEWEAPTFRVDSASPVEAGIDGEAVLLDPPLVFEIRPGALRVRIPAGAVQRRPVSPPARLDRPTIRTVVSVAAGRTAGADLPDSGTGP